MCWGGGGGGGVVWVLTCRVRVGAYMYSRI